MNMAKVVLPKTVYYRKLVGNDNLICQDHLRQEKDKTCSCVIFEINSYCFMQWTQDALKPPVKTK